MRHPITSSLIVLVVIVVIISISTYLVDVQFTSTLTTSTFTSTTTITNTSPLPSYAGVVSLDQLLFVIALCCIPILFLIYAYENDKN